MSDDDGESGSETPSRSRVLRWLLLEGDRLAIAGGVAVATFGLLAALVQAGLLDVGPRSSIRTLLSSGIAAGLITLVTISLSINQLVLSRVFGSPRELTDRLEGSVEFRDRVAALAGRPAVPTDPAGVLVLLGPALDDRVAVLATPAGESSTDGTLEAELASLADGIEDYAALLSDVDRSDTFRALTAVLGPRYAELFAESRRIQRAHGDRLDGEPAEALVEVCDLLRTVAVLRQFFKTVTLQQDLARLSRLIVYSGLLGLLVTYALSLVYRSSSGATLSAGVLAWVAPAGLAVTALPLAIFVAYILRVATISRYTTSVGPFVPPEERFGRHE